MPVATRKRQDAPSERRRPTRSSASRATAAPATRAAEIAPGSAYAVEVTSISASVRPVMVARADHSMAAIQISPASARR